MKYPTLYNQLNKWFMRKTLKSSVRRVAELPFTIGSDIGVSRDQNQDRIAVLRSNFNSCMNYTIMAVCDGMGGMEAGDTCAAITISAFFASFIENVSLPTDERLICATKAANDIIFSLYHQKGGSTLSAMFIDGKGKALGVNVGDSRIYSCFKMKLKQLTIDDTIAGQLSLGNDPNNQLNQLVQFIGIGEELEPHLVELPPPHDMLCLTTDGLHCIGNNLMLNILQTANDSGIALKRMIDVAKWSGSHDNISLVIAVPSLIPQETRFDLDLIQVWDPFGDLQIFPFTEAVDLKSPVVNNRNNIKSEVESTEVKSKSNQRKSSRKTKKLNKQTNKQTLKNTPEISVSFDKSSNEDVKND